MPAGAACVPLGVPSTSSVTVEPASAVPSPAADAEVKTEPAAEPVPVEEELAQRQMFDSDEAQDPMSGKGVSSEGLIEKALGLQVTALNPQITRQLGVSDDTKGLVILAVDPSADAAAKGLQRGDIILSANYKGLGDVSDLEGAVRNVQSSGREAILLRIQRRGRTATYVPVRLR